MPVLAYIGNRLNVYILLSSWSKWTAVQVAPIQRTPLFGAFLFKTESVANGNAWASFS